MKDFLKKVVLGNGISPSKICMKAFNQNFEDAINTEWYPKGEYFEAIFYLNNLEHIARFNLEGKLTEYSQNLPADYLAEPIKNKALSKGEIMNSVMKNKGNTLEYEIITRDLNLNRTMMILTDIGKIVEEKKL